MGLNLSGLEDTPLVQSISAFTDEAAAAELRFRAELRFSSYWLGPSCVSAVLRRLPDNVSQTP